MLLRLKNEVQAMDLKYFFFSAIMLVIDIVLFGSVLNFFMIE